VIDCNEWKTETPRMCKYGESKTTRIMMASVPHVTSGSRLKISGRWIFVRQSVPHSHIFKMNLKQHKRQKLQKDIFILLQVSSSSSQKQPPYLPPYGYADSVQYHSNNLLLLHKTHNHQEMPKNGCLYLKRPCLPACHRAHE